MQPPRFLWVPFELGRPLGSPNEADFQRRVLHESLKLLEAKNGPVLADFPDDAPLPVSDMTSSVSPVPLPPIPPTSNADLASQMQYEIDQLSPWYELAVSSRNRSTVGLSGLNPSEAGQFIAQWLDTAEPQTYREGLSLGRALKLTSEDLKAYYLEAATARPGTSISSRAAANWFWQKTAAGRILHTIHPRCIQSSNGSVRAIAERSLIPRSQSKAP